MEVWPQRDAFFTSPGMSASIFVHRQSAEKLPLLRFPEINPQKIFEVLQLFEVNSQFSQLFPQGHSSGCGKIRPSNNSRASTRDHSSGEI